jgi:hypothetical protein
MIVIVILDVARLDVKVIVHAESNRRWNTRHAVA